METVLKEAGYSEVEPMELYSELFHLGEGLIQKSTESSKETGLYKPNPIILGRNNGKITRRILFEDTFEETLSQFQDSEFSILNGVLYFGRANKSENAGAISGLIFDLDGITPRTLENFLSGATSGTWYPLPNYIALSGQNIHLYYILEEPLQLYPGTKIRLKSLKYALTRRMWNRYTSTIEEPQYQGINQGFRIIGGKTKVSGKRVKAFRVNTHPVSIEYLNEFVPTEERIDISETKKESRWTLEEAKKRFPEWYQRVVVNGEPSGQWVCNEKLYLWWIEQIKQNATVGHRYWCILALCCYAAKCGIYDKERVKRDALTLRDHLNDLDKQQPFTEQDIDCALEALDPKFVRFSRKEIERLTAISIPSHKRNGRKRKEHLALLNATNKFRKETLGEHIGRPDKKELVEDYFRHHPKATVRGAAKELGISHSTVQRWKPKKE